MDVKELLKKGYIVLDGAMGTMLQKKGMKVAHETEELEDSYVIKISLPKNKH